MPLLSAFRALGRRARHDGRRRLGAFAAPSVLSLLATAFYVVSVGPATPRSLRQPVAPAMGAGAPVVMPAPAGEGLPDLEPVVAVEPQAPEAASEPAPAPAAEREPCRDALAEVAGAGLPFPAGVDYRCPSTRFAHQGAACWDDWPCPGGAFVAINLDLGAGATPAYMRHVVAHEICHILDFRDRGWSTEAGADACAAGYGF